jgi:tetratricopeptide (TPR) repeat protein/predicted Ser/Thr protein kinase
MSPDDLLEEILDDWQTAFERGEDLSTAELCRDCPQLLPEVEQRVSELRRWARLASPGGTDTLAVDSGSTIVQPLVDGYDIERELGRGGMGVVYRAHDRGLNRTVALKMVLHGTHARHQDIIRFLAEAETAAQLQHHGIAQIFGTGTANGLPYFVMEYVDGGPLADRLKAGPMPLREAARISEQLAEAVAYAHSAGVVHRDLKPNNIMLTSAGVPKVTDFGLAKRLRSDSGLTTTGAVLGTPSYMPPEQAQGDLNRVGPAADVYSLGAILYEMLTGRPPFWATDALKTLDLVRSSPPTRPRSDNPAVPRDLETICLKCLEKDPPKRYATAEALADDLRRYQDGRAILARQVGVAERVGRWAKRHPSVATLLAVVFGLLVTVAVGAVVAAVRIDEARRQADRNAKAVTQALVQTEKARAIAADEAKAALEVSQFLGKLFEPQDMLPLGAAGLGFRGSEGNKLTARELLTAGTKRLEAADLTAQPLVRARLLHQVGVIWLGVGELPTARRLLTQALALRQDHLARDHADLARSLLACAQANCLAEDAATLPQFREAIRIFEKTDPGGLELAEALAGLGMSGEISGLNPGEAESLSKRALEIRKRQLGENDIRTILTEAGLGYAYVIGASERSSAKLRATALSVFARLERSQADPRVKEIVGGAVKMVGIQAILGEKAAIAQYRTIVEKCDQVFGAGHIVTLMVKADFAERLFLAVPRDDLSLQECVDLNHEILKALDAWGVTLPWRAGSAHLNLGRALRDSGRLVEAEAELRRAAALFRQGRPEQASKLPHTLQALAVTLAATRNPDKQAEIPEVLREALEMCRDNRFVPNYRLGHQLMDYGRVLLDRGDAAVAEPLFAEAVDVYRRAENNRDNMEVVEALAFRVAALRAMNRPDEAVAVLKVIEPFSQKIDRLSNKNIYALRARGALDGKPQQWMTDPFWHRPSPNFVSPNTPGAKSPDSR